MSAGRIIFRGVMLGLSISALGAAAVLALVVRYAQTDRVFPGVTVGNVAIGGLDRRAAVGRISAALTPDAHLQTGPPTDGASGRVGQAALPAGMFPSPSQLRLRWEDKVWAISMDQFGEIPTIQGMVADAFQIGRSGGLLRSTAAFTRGLMMGHRIPLFLSVHDKAVLERLEVIARELNRPAVDARYDVESDTVHPDVQGQELNRTASLQAVRSALLSGRREAVLTVRNVAPAVRKTDLDAARQLQVAQFRTPILAADTGRVHNIALAVRKIRGAIVKPGEIFSFNERVGPRDAAHGWAPAMEIYQGEFVPGFGGGICQVSSTLYNAVLLSGLEVKERYHHDRPLQYIDPGRDATVVWQVLDFKFRNNSDVPILMDARVLPGTPQQIAVSVHAPRKIRTDTISISDSVVRYLPPYLIEVPDATLPATERRVVDEGHYGIEVKIYRNFRESDQERRELVSHDRYEAKDGKVNVGVGNAPGSRRLLEPGIR